MYEKKLWHSHMHVRRGMTLALAGILTLSQAFPSIARDQLGEAVNGWVWEDINDDGTYECYYRDWDFFASCDQEFQNAVHSRGEKNIHDSSVRL